VAVVVPELKNILRSLSAFSAESETTCDAFELENAYALIQHETLSADDDIEGKVQETLLVGVPPGILPMEIAELYFPLGYVINCPKSVNTTDPDPVT
jgi:hypothetical protein